MSTKRRFIALRLGASVIAAATGFATPVLADHLDPASTTMVHQSRPIPLGVSGSSQTLLRVNNLLYCYAGTLGSLVRDQAGTQYILSNNHVLAKENENLAYGGSPANETIIQESNLDEGPCSIGSGIAADKVAALSGFVEIMFGKGRNKPLNSADAAMASVDNAPTVTNVRNDGSILGIGTVGGVADAAVGLAVQKTGRTTAHTFGKIEATDVTIDVSYESGTARFANQLRIRRPCDDAGFSAAGDSGSLIATVPADTSSSAMAVGLLFAGGSTDTFANPIGAVLSELSASTGTSLSMAAPSSPTVDPDATMSQYSAITCPTGTSGGSGGGGNGHGKGPHSVTGAPADLDVARQVLASHSEEIFALPDVVGHGVGVNASGNAVIEIYVAKAAQRAAGIPTQIQGIPVRVVVTGPIRAF